MSDPHVYTADGRRLYTQRQLAEQLGVPHSTITTWRSRGKLAEPDVRLDGRTPLWTKETATMGAETPAEPIARAVYGREIRVRGRVFRALHVDGYAHIDVLTRREPRFESDRDDDRDEWVRVERYTTLDLRFDDAARRRFDAWVERDLRAELDEPGKHLRTYR